MGKKKITTINNTPLEIQTIGYVKKHKYGWIGLIVLLIMFGGIIFFLPDLETLANKYINGGGSVSTPIMSNENETTNENTEEIQIEYNSLQEKNSYTFNGINFANIKYENGVFSYELSGEEEINLSSKSYFVELFDQDKTLIKRKYLSEKVPVSGKVLSKITVDEPTFYVIREIPESQYDIIMLDLNDNKESILTCKKNAQTITYTFKDEKLSSIMDVTSFDNLSEEMSTYYNTQIENNQNIEGLSSSLGENNYTIEVDSSLYTGNKVYYFNKDAKPIEVNYKMKAMDYNCE